MSGTEKNTPTEPVVHPGFTKEVWDEALARSGLDPSKVTEYNTEEDSPFHPSKAE